jgi:hypothetical protein
MWGPKTRENLRAAIWPRGGSETDVLPVQLQLVETPTALKKMVPVVLAPHR